MLKKLFLTAAAIVFASASARGADTVEPAAYDWSGPYIGLQAGYGWDKPSVNLDKSPALAPTDIDVGSFSRDGFVGGAFAGYLFQHDNLVFGLEGDVEYSDMKGSTRVVQAVDLDVGRLENDIDWLASFRLRAGYAMDRVLVYATGGLAIGGTELDFSPGSTDFLTVNRDSDNATKIGWTIGGGLEYAIADNLSIRAEYRYTDLGKTDVRVRDSADAAYFQDLEVKNSFHAVRAGVSSRF